MRWPSLSIRLLILLNLIKIHKSQKNDHAGPSPLKRKQPRFAFDWGHSQTDIVDDIYSEVIKLRDDITKIKKEFPEISKSIKEVKMDIIIMKGDVVGVNGKLSKIQMLKNDFANLKNTIDDVTKIISEFQGDFSILRRDMSKVYDNAHGVWVNMSQVNQDVAGIQRMLQAVVRNITSNIRDNSDDYSAIYSGLSNVTLRFDSISSIWPTLAGYVNISTDRLHHLSDSQDQLNTLLKQQGHSTTAEFGRLGQKIDTTTFTMATESMRKHRELIDAVNNVGTQVGEIRRMILGISSGSPGQLPSLPKFSARSSCLSSGRCQFRTHPFGGIPSFLPTQTPPLPPTPPLPYPSFTNITDQIYPTNPTNKSNPLLEFPFTNLTTVSIGNIIDLFNSSRFEPIIGVGGIGGAGRITGIAENMSGLVGGFGGIVVAPNPPNITLPANLTDALAWVTNLSSNTLSANNPTDFPDSMLSTTPVPNFIWSNWPQLYNNAKNDASQWPWSYSGFSESLHDPAIQYDQYSSIPNARTPILLPGPDIPGLPIRGVLGPGNGNMHKQILSRLPTPIPPSSIPGQYGMQPGNLGWSGHQASNVAPPWPSSTSQYPSFTALPQYGQAAPPSPTQNPAYQPVVSPGGYQQIPPTPPYPQMQPQNGYLVSSQPTAPAYPPESSYNGGTPTQVHRPIESQRPRPQFESSTGRSEPQPSNNGNYISNVPVLTLPTSIPLATGPLAGKCICTCPCSCVCPSISRSNVPTTTHPPSYSTKKNVFSWWQPNSKRKATESTRSCTCLCPCDCPKVPASTSKPSWRPPQENQTTHPTTSRPHIDPGTTAQWPAHVVQDQTSPTSCPDHSIVDELIPEFRSIRDDIKSLKQSLENNMTSNRAAIKGDLISLFDEMKYVLADMHHANVALHNDHINRTESLKKSFRDHVEETLFMMTAISNLLEKIHGGITLLVRPNDGEETEYQNHAPSNDYSQFVHNDFYGKSQPSTGGKSRPQKSTIVASTLHPTKPSESRRKIEAITTPALNNTEQLNCNETITSNETESNTGNICQKDPHSNDLIDVRDTDHNPTEEIHEPTHTNPEYENALEKKATTNINTNINPNWPPAPSEVPIKTTSYLIPTRGRTIIPVFSDVRSYLTKLGLKPFIPKSLIQPIQTPIVIKPPDPYHLLSRMPGIPKEVLQAVKEKKPFQAAYSDGNGNNVNINVSRRNSKDKVEEDQNLDHTQEDTDISAESQEEDDLI